MKNKVSIITPLYNVSKTICRTLDTLINQGDGIEFIFVNDCSTDNSLDIVCSYKQKLEESGSTVIIVSNESNRGVAYSREKGLSLASGEYVYWVDADDYLDNGAIMTMYNHAKSKNLDIVGCEFTLSFNKNERKMNIPNIKGSYEAFKSMCYGILKWNLWLFMVKLSIIKENNIHFIEGANMGEDMMFMGLCFTNSITTEIIHKPLYHYVRNNVDAMTQNYNTKNIEEVDANLRLLVNNLSDKNIYFINFLKLNIKLPQLISTKFNDYKIWRDRYPESNKYIFKNTKQSFKTKILQWVAYKKLYMLVYIYNRIIMKLIYGFMYK